ncbi:hypothetical protein CDIK_3453 [Cucumispora dikerogammari]|nr:hypothetical protein CDIK_3453 [Cucumispora dikerogammari]
MTIRDVEDLNSYSITNNTQREEQSPIKVFRKKSTLINYTILKQIDRLYKPKNITEISNFCGISVKSVYLAIQKLNGQFKEEEIQFDNLFKKPGRKPKDSQSLLELIIDILGDDNSLRQARAIKSIIKITQFVGFFCLKINLKGWF